MVVYRDIDPQVLDAHFVCKESIIAVVNTKFEYYIR